MWVCLWVWTMPDAFFNRVLVKCEEYYMLDTTGKIQIKVLRSLGFHHYNIALCHNEYNEMPVCHVADTSFKVVDMGSKI